MTSPKELCQIAWKCYEKGYLDILDYIKICNKNHQLAF